MMFSSSGDGKKPETDVLKARAEITGIKQLGTRTGTRVGTEEGCGSAIREGVV